MGSMKSSQALSGPLDHYGVDLRGLVDHVVMAAMRCHPEGRTAPITAAHQWTLGGSAEALAVRRDLLAAAWDDRIRRDVALGRTAAQAVDLLDVDALHDAIGALVRARCIRTR